MFLLVFFMGCDDIPSNYFQNPKSDGATGNWTGKWLIFGDKLETGGGLICMPGGENQKVEIKDTNAPNRGKVIYYNWNGNKVTGQKEWCGVSLSVASNWLSYDSTPSRDISEGGYEKVTFWAKIKLKEHTYIRFEGPVPSLCIQQYEDCDWQFFTIQFKPHMLKKVKDYFIISFHYENNENVTKTGGGEVSIDQVMYER